MPFGMTNDPSTFQSLMNEVFKPYSQCFVLVLFDDILIYSKTLQDHVRHLELVILVLPNNVLFAKYSKCTFGSRKVEYLGHYIEEKGVSTDPRKVEAVKTGQCQQTSNNFEDFFGLTWYYRRFVQWYGAISKPLTTLLKKDGFFWNEHARLSFEQLKTTMISTHTLALSYFTKVFTLETNACFVGIGAVLMQEGHHIAYISKALAKRHLGLSVYDKNSCP